MEANSEVRAVAFDAYGTLFDVTSVRAACRAELAQVGAEGATDAVVATWRTKQLEYTWLLSLMGRFEDFWSVTRRALDFATRAAGATLEEPARDRLLDAYLQLDAYPDVIPSLDRLGKLDDSKLPLGVLSNGSQQMLDAALKRADLTWRFDHVLSADRAGTFKPSPSVYQLACDAFGAEPGCIAFASSNPWDIAGAASFGFITVRVDRLGQPEESLDLPADLTVESLQGLADWLVVVGQRRNSEPQGGPHR